jgi:hypothetical protein
MSKVGKYVSVRVTQRMQYVAIRQCVCSNKTLLKNVLERLLHLQWHTNAFVSSVRDLTQCAAVRYGLTKATHISSQLKLTNIATYSHNFNVPWLLAHNIATHCSCPVQYSTGPPMTVSRSCH